MSRLGRWSYSPLVRADVEIQLRLGKVFGDRIAGKQDRSSRVARKALLELVQERLVSKAPAIDLIRDRREGRPRVAVIRGAIDREPRLAARIVFPRAQQRSRVLLSRKRVRTSRMQERWEEVVNPQRWNPKERMDCQYVKVIAAHLTRMAKDSHH